MSSTAEPIERTRFFSGCLIKSDDGKGLIQVLTTLVPIAILWGCAALAAETSAWLLAAITALMSLFLIRVFVLMHDCGHGSLFRSAPLNRAFGFVFGVLAGMPQQVWAQHHAYHHLTNGNWAKYRGPLNVIPVDEYAVMTSSQQRKYRYTRSIWLAPLAGFLYLVFNPRLSWLRSSVGLVRHVVAKKMAPPSDPDDPTASEFRSSCCASVQEYWWMFWNNVALLGLWGLMCWAIGPIAFFACYAASVALAGGAAIVLFTVQHNFEHSYASGDEGWDRGVAAMEGTSFLVLPGWLNWFTANIGYHHIHHLCAGIPNYRLVRCHDEQAQLYEQVRRIRLWEIPRSLKYILWDRQARRIVSVAELRAD